MASVLCYLRRSGPLQILLLARLKGQRPVYGALVDDRTYPATMLGLAGPLDDARSRRRFLAGRLPTDPARAAWAQRQHWAFPILAMRAAPVLGNDVAQVAAPPVPATATYRQQFVRCGKPTCSRCRTGPSHGPYWYAYWHANGTLHKRYLGHTDPHAADAALSPASHTSPMSSSATGDSSPTDSPSHA